MKIGPISILCETEVANNDEDITDDIDSFEAIEAVFTDKATDLPLSSMNPEQHLLLICSLAALGENITMSDPQSTPLTDKIITEIMNIEDIQENTENEDLSQISKMLFTEF